LNKEKNIAIIPQEYGEELLLRDVLKSAKIFKKYFNE
jgi:hypothetical protein